MFFDLIPSLHKSYDNGRLCFLANFGGMCKGDGRCIIDIDVDNRNHFDQATDSELKQAAADVLSKCVLAIPSSGGVARGIGECDPSSHSPST